MSRFFVELVGNHHYMLFDEVTGRSYYVPGREDSHSLCRLLNDKDNLLERQRHHINELESSLSKNGVVFEPNRTCKNCEFSSFNFVVSDGECYCESKEVNMSVNDYCNRWKLKI